MAFLCVLYLLAVCYSDIRDKVIPDLLSLFGAITSLPFIFANPIGSLVGFGVSGGLMLILALLTNGIGGGDIKLSAVLGLILGTQVFPALILAFVLGGIFTTFLLVTGIKKAGESIPFGPFLALGGAITLFGGIQLWG